MVKRYFTCMHCGIDFVTTQRSKYIPKYCSRSCFNDAQFGEIIPNKIGLVRNPMCLEALKLYQTGLSQREAARRAGISQYVLTEWLRKYGKEMRPSSLKQRLQGAKTAKKWLSVLRGAAPIKSRKSGPATRLICEVTYGNAGMNKLVTIISEGLRIDPLNGEIFAFCNKEHNIITTITWNGTMFIISNFPRQHGKYPWPHERFGASITASASEFEALMFFQQERVK